jgi:uncharacterized protein YkwD
MAGMLTRRLLLASPLLLLPAVARADELRVREMVQAVNVLRRRYQLPELNHNSLVAQVAQRQAEDFAGGTPPRADSSWVSDRLQRVGYNGSGSIGWVSGSDQAQTALDGLMTHTGLERDLRDRDLKDMGVGYTRRARANSGGYQVPYWVLIFSTPRKAR